MGKSFRTHLDTELIRFGEDYLKAELLFCDRNREHTLEIIILREKKKQIKINGVTISRLSELMGHLNVVLFYPEELGLVKRETCSNDRRVLRCYPTEKSLGERRQFLLNFPQAESLFIF